MEPCCVNIIGSCFNVCLGKGPEFINFKLEDDDKFIKILEMMMAMFVSKENKDYLGTALMISLKLVENEQFRKKLRRHFLNVQNNQM